MRPLNQTRIDKILPVIKFLIKKKSKIIVISHVGRPKGKINEDLSLKPICEYLEKKINKKIKLINENVFTLDKKKKGADHKISLMPKEFKFMVERSKNFLKMLHQSSSGTMLPFVWIFRVILLACFSFTF